MSLTEGNDYACFGFCKCLPKGRASGQLKVNASGLHFRIQGENVYMAFSQLQMTMGGANNRLVFFTHPSHPQWRIYTSNHAILKDPTLSSQPDLQFFLKSSRRKAVINYLGLATVALLIIALPIFFVVRLDMFTNLAAKQIPASWEEELGQSLIAQHRLSHEFMGSEQSQRILKPLVSPMLEALPESRYHYDFHIINDSSLNAFALPGGEVVIHSALVLRAKSVEELLGVLAHEITHVEQQHGLRNVLGAASVYLLAAALFGDVSGILALATSAAPLLVNQSYSRGFETEADLKGYALLKAAKIDPSGLARFFETLMIEEQKQLESIEDEGTRDLLEGAMAFLSTHPASQERIARLKELEKHSDQVQFVDLSTEFSKLQGAVRLFVDEQRDNGVKTKVHRSTKILPSL